MVGAYSTCYTIAGGLHQPSPRRRARCEPHPHPNPNQEVFSNLALGGVHAASLDADDLLMVLKAALVARKFKVRIGLG